MERNILRMTQRFGDDRVTTPYLTKYEICRLLGTRSTAIALNAKIDSTSYTNALDISLQELKSGKVPLKIRRYLPDGSFEDWHLDELKL